MQQIDDFKNQEERKTLYKSNRAIMHTASTLKLILYKLPQESIFFSEINEY